MNSVVLLYPTGARRDVLLAGVPRVGDQIRPSDTPAVAPSWVVEHVLWMEVNAGSPEPSVIIVLRNHVADPKV